MAVAGTPLPAYLRFFCYGVHGFFDEIVFTAIYDYIYLKPDPRLIGYTSLYSFLIYGLCSFMVERLYVFLWYKHKVPTPARVMIYVVIVYVWEFSCGFLLRQFNACPWDYSDRSLNVMGLITFTYLPGWALLAVWQDVIADFLLSLRTVPAYQPVHNKLH